MFAVKPVSECDVAVADKVAVSTPFTFTIIDVRAEPPSFGVLHVRSICDSLMAVPFKSLIVPGGLDVVIVLLIELELDVPWVDTDFK